MKLSLRPPPKQAGGLDLAVAEGFLSRLAIAGKIGAKPSHQADCCRIHAMLSWLTKVNVHTVLFFS